MILKNAKKITSKINESANFQRWHAFKSHGTNDTQYIKIPTKELHKTLHNAFNNTNELEWNKLYLK